MSLLNNKQIKELIKNRFNIINDNTRLKININDITKFLNDNNLTKEHIKQFIKNEKKDSYTIQLQENINNSLINNINNKQILKNFKNIASENDIMNNLINPINDEEIDNKEKINNYENSSLYYIKKFIYDYIINLKIKNNLFEVNKISLSKINSLLSQHLKNNYYEYNKDLNFKNINDFNNFIKNTFNYNIENNIINVEIFKNILYLSNDKDKNLLKKRLKFIREIKSSIITKNITKITKYQNLYEFKILSEEYAKNKNLI